MAIHETPNDNNIDLSPHNIGKFVSKSELNLNHRKPNGFGPLNFLNQFFNNFPTGFIFHELIGGNNRNNQPVINNYIGVNPGQQEPKQKKEQEKEPVNILLAVAVFTAAIFSAAVSIMWGFKKVSKAFTNLLINRKKLASILRLTFSTLYGYFGALYGLQIGKMYFTPLFGTLAPAVGVGLMVSVGVCAGVLTAKGLSQLIHGLPSWMNGHGFTGNSSPYSFNYSAQGQLNRDKQNLEEAVLLKGFLKNHIEELSSTHADQNLLSAYKTHLKELNQGKISRNLIGLLEKHSNDLNNGENARIHSDSLELDRQALNTLLAPN